MSSKKIINIRRNIFETNSSSMHSISLCLDGTKVLPNVNENEPYRVALDGFGWEEETYDDFNTKLSYLITYICDANFDRFSEESPTYDELEEVAHFIKLMKVLTTYAGITKLSINFSYDYYIDHQSHDVAYDLLEGTEEDIADFLFNPKSLLVTDNDNH